MPKKKGGDHGGGGHDAAGGLRWLLTYADLITLLLVFFIVVAAISSADQQKMQEVARAIAEAFTPLWSDRPFLLPGEGTGTQLRTPGQIGTSGRGAIFLMRQLEQVARDLRIRNVVVSHQENAVIDFPAADLFETGTVTALRPEAREFLDRFAALLAVADQNVEVSAHVAAGTADAWGITSARSLAVVRYLVERRNVPPERLIAAAAGTTPHRIGEGREPAAADGVTFYLFGGGPRPEGGPPPVP